MGNELVAGDTASTLIVTCKDNATKAALDLTGATVRLRYRIDGGALQVKTMTVQSPATAGTAEYQWTSGELTAGTLLAEVEITDAAGKVMTSLEPLYLPVRAKLT